MSGRTASVALKTAISEGVIGPPSLVCEPGSPHHAALFYDLDEFEDGIAKTKEAFGEGKRKNRHSLTACGYCFCLVVRKEFKNVFEKIIVIS